MTVFNEQQFLWVVVGGLLLCTLHVFFGKQTIRPYAQSKSHLNILQVLT